jgi:hypothetical protein
VINVAKIVTYNTLVRVGKALLTQTQKDNEDSLLSLTGVFKGYISKQSELKSNVLKGDFYISNAIMTFSYNNRTSVMGISKDTIFIALKDSPDSNNREDWVIIKSTLVTEMLNLKDTLEEHINNKNNPHEVTLTQANGDVISDSTFSEILELV